MPPVSGGAARFASSRVTDEPLDLGAVCRRGARPARPARSSCFEGVTREVAALDYEAYVEMAETKLRAIGEEEAARARAAARSRSCTASARVPLSEP